MIDLEKQIAYLKTMDETVAVAYEIEQILNDLGDLNDDLRAYLDDEIYDWKFAEKEDVCRLLPALITKLPPFVHKMNVGELLEVLSEYE